MKRLVICISALFLLFACVENLVAAPGTGLLDDGGFENADHQSDVSNSAWVLTANKPDGVDLAARFQVSGFARSDGAPGTGAGLWARSFEGNQGGSGQDLAMFTLVQSISAPSSGDYNLDFDWAREVSFTAATFGVTLESGGTGGNATIDLLAATPVNGDNFNELLSSNGGPNVASIGLTGVTAGDTLTVTAFMTGGEDVGGEQSAFLDNFVLTVVPEPSSVMLMGLGGVGLLSRRRR